MPDISPEYLHELKVSYYKTHVVVTQEEADLIELQTRGQSDCALWTSERSKRITASRVGGIVKMREKTKRSKIEGGRDTIHEV